MLFDANASSDHCREMFCFNLQWNKTLILWMWTVICLLPLKLYDNFLSDFEHRSGNLFIIFPPDSQCLWSFPNFDFCFFLLESTPCPLWRSYCMLPDRCKVITTKNKIVYISWFLLILCTHRIFLLVDPKDAITFLEKTKEKVGLFTMKYTLRSQFVTPRLLKYQLLSEDVLNVIVKFSHINKHVFLYSL